MRDVRRIHAIRLALRGRERAGRPADVAVTVYGAVLAGLVLGVPIVRALVVAFADPSLGGAVTTAGAAGSASAAAAVLLALASAAGSVRGPAVPSPTVASIVANGPLPRRNVLAATFLGSAAGLVLTLTGIVAVPAAGFVLGGVWRLDAAVALLVGTGLLGVTAVVAWLVGQRLTARAAEALAVAAVLIAVVTGPFALVRDATPWGAIQVLWARAGDGVAWPALLVLAVVAVLAASLVPWLLDGLDGERLATQASRWQRVGTAVGALDGAGAVGELRGTPVLGRRWRAVLPVPRVLVVPLADAISTARRPVVVLAGGAALVVAGLLVAVEPPHAIAWALAGATALAGVTGLATGLRDAGSSLLGPPVFGGGPGALLVAHTLWPFVAGTLVFWASALCAGASPGTAVPLVALVACAVSIVAAGSVKGPLPLALLAPVPTAVGDASVLAVLGWQLDGPLLMIAASTIAGALAAEAGTLTGAIPPALGVGLALVLLVRRLRRA